MSALRFCFLTTFYPPYNFGGDGIGVQRLARALVRAGHHVTVVHDADAFHALAPAGRDGPARHTENAGTRTPMAETEPAGLDVVTLRSRLGTASLLLTQQVGRPVINGRRIARLLREGRFDVINYHNISLIGGPGLLRYGSALKAYIAHEHWLVCPTHVLWRHGREVCTERECFRCQLSYRRPPQLWRHTGLLERRLRHVDLFIALSEFSRDKHHEFGFPREMSVLPHFLANDARPPLPARPHARPYFLFAGRLEKIKGLQDLLPQFAGEGPVDLLVAGEGDYGAELRSGAEGLSRVHFLGRVANETLTRYYQHAIALVVPSVGYETFGLTLLEAFRESTPVIARRLGSLTEIVEQSGGGVLFSTAAESRAAMERMASDTEYRATLAAAGRESFLARWTEEKIIPGYVALLRQAAQRKGDARLAHLLQ